MYFELHEKKVAAYKDRKLIFMSEFLLLRIAESTTYFPTNFLTWLPNMYMSSTLKFSIFYVLRFLFVVFKKSRALLHMCQSNFQPIWSSFGPVPSQPGRDYY